ncbi:hypothetical protein ACFSC6_11595 [Rufibacter sediminis]|uniref:Entericidin n=1 Tax=Rufibacter sediminis TaxID=2762756 RepID=A0ABR6VTK7_9BACT|nr:hypothetical protein [Rufibacter sediminis]MBC3540523.1 hypothetical protein [Rufibacter sediminis]
MKKVSKGLAMALMALAFGFTSCESKTAQNVENTAESAADEISAEADSAFDDADAALTPTDTLTVKDEPVNDGVADKVENQ